MTGPLSDTVSVVLADDHPFFLDGVVRLLGSVDDIALLGTATTGARALAMICETRPAIAVLDIAMPEIDGIAVARLLAQRAPATRTIILSVFEDQDYLSRAVEAGARGYVLKRSASENLLVAIRSVSHGGFYIDPSVAGRLLPTLGRGPLRARGPTAAPRLTARETEVLRMIAMGYTIKEIAARIGVTGKSIETYKVRAAEKMKLGSRAKIVQYAMVQGWFQDGPAADGFIGVAALETAGFVPEPGAPH